MSNKMLIDVAHAEETRVAVVRGQRIEEFDFESASRKPLRGNIYLAKVTRVEPSLQAAFVDYGGNRHGFLAFSEIHPDYYQIPVADRQVLLEQEAADEVAAESAEEDAEGGNGRRRRGRRRKTRAGNGPEAPEEETDEPSRAAEEDGGEEEPSPGEDDSGAENGDDDIESVGSEDALEEVPRRAAHRRSYKIQEVIKRRQVILVQVVKEERGTKGAALTTYLSLAGRHCVLMPNTARGGGISRKITNASDRRRLREIANGLNVPEGMGLIIRTAGAKRTKAEIKRDFDYLLRLWESVRDLTLQSSAPTLVYEEGSLIKRSIRDLYNKDIDEVLVEGEEGYKEAKSFMRMLMPSHAKNVKLHKGDRPIFIDQGIESQLDAMFEPVVTLRSGGYLVINQTEALVAIDVNSGKSTREHNIEDTALKTNLEAAEEIARQLRLRDLAGLIVIDFIDMEQRRNNRAVERRLKEQLKNDRARIQVGRISGFGLLEMSRQRLRTGMLEGSTVICPHCEGRGFIRSVESSALHVLRSVEENLLSRGAKDLVVHASVEVVFYILNQKRTRLLSLEERYGVTIFIEGQPALVGGQVEIGAMDEAARARSRKEIGGIQLESVYEARADAETGADGRRRKRGGRRRSRGGEEQADAEVEAAAQTADETGEDSGQGRKGSGRRRRGRRGGRRVQRRRAIAGDSEESSAETEETSAPEPAAQAAAGEAMNAEAPEPKASEPEASEPEKPGKTAAGKSGARRPRRKTSEPAAEAVEPAAADTAETIAGTDKDEETKAKRPPKGRKTAAARKGKTKVAKPAAEADESEAGAPTAVKSASETGEDGSGKAPSARRPRAKRTRKKAETAEAAETPEPAGAGSASSNGDAGSDTGAAKKSDESAAPAHGAPRRGWWQRSDQAGE